MRASPVLVSIGGAAAAGRSSYRLPRPWRGWRRGGRGGSGHEAGLRHRVEQQVEVDHPAVRAGRVSDEPSTAAICGHDPMGTTASECEPRPRRCQTGVARFQRPREHNRCSPQPRDGPPHRRGPPAPERAAARTRHPGGPRGQHSRCARRGSRTPSGDRSRRPPHGAGRLGVPSTRRSVRRRLPLEGRAGDVPDHARRGSRELPARRDQLAGALVHRSRDAHAPARSHGVHRSSRRSLRELTAVRGQAGPRRSQRTEARRNPSISPRAPWLDRDCGGP
jgi:hypothetical protein